MASIFGNNIRKQKLDAVEMVWHLEDPWMAKYRVLEQNHTKHGHTNMSADSVVNGVWLHRWLSEQKAWLNGKPTGKNKTVKVLTDEQIALLANVGVASQQTTS